MKKKSISIGIGIISLLMIFIILCMVILAVLSYQNASQSEALALREKETLTQYYETQETASILYAQIVQQKGKTLDEIQAFLEENTIENVTSSLKNDILTITIQMINETAFHMQVNEQFEICYWGQGEVQ